MPKDLHSTYLLRGDVRAHLMSMDDGQIQASLARANIDVSRLIFEIETQTKAMDEYIASTAHEFTPSLLKWRLKMTGALGGIGLVIFLTTIGMLWFGNVQSDNANILAGVALLGSTGLTLIAVWAAFHVLLEAALHFWGRAKIAEELNGNFAKTTAEFGKSYANLAGDIREFFCRNPHIRAYFKTHGYYVQVRD